MDAPATGTASTSKSPSERASSSDRKSLPTEKDVGPMVDPAGVILSSYTPFRSPMTAEEEIKVPGRTPAARVVDAVCRVAE